MVLNQNSVLVPVDNHDQIMDIMDWCEECIGPRLREWDFSYADDSDYNYNGLFYFRTPQQATMFRLRWS